MTNLVITIALLVIYSLSIGLVSKAIDKVGQSKSVKTYRVKYVIKTINLLVTVVFVSLLLLFWGIEYTQVTFFLSSVFAVIGIALFAQWSILSNITASLIIFFAFPYRVGDKIKIIDGDEVLFGEINEITLFHVLIKCEEDLITYPNSMMLQRAVIKLPDDFDFSRYLDELGNEDKNGSTQGS
jgi:small-conductance mechanosensitive channel